MKNEATLTFTGISEYILGGYTGNGMNFCFKAGKDIAQLILNENNEIKEGDDSTSAILRRLKPYSPHRFHKK